MSPDHKKRIYYTANWIEYKWTTDWNCQCSPSSTWVYVNNKDDDGTLWMPLKCSFKQNKKPNLDLQGCMQPSKTPWSKNFVFFFILFLRSSTRRWCPSLPAQIADDAENYDLLSRKQNKRATRNRVRHLGLEFKIQHDYMKPFSFTQHHVDRILYNHAFLSR